MIILHIASFLICSAILVAAGIIIGLYLGRDRKP